MKRHREINDNLYSFVQEQTAITLKNFNPEKGDEPTNYIEAFYKAQKERKENSTFTHAQLIASVANLFGGGTDTTATTLRWAIFYMCHYPELQDKVYEEIKTVTGCQALLNFADRTKLPFTEATILEIQRLANLVPTGATRRTLAPSKLCGYDIPADTLIVVDLTRILWDPKVYPNPRVFDPSRFMKGRKNEEKGDEITHLIPFQAGKRVCLGESLAKMELFIFFTALVSRYKFSFSPNEPKPPFESKMSMLHTPPKYNVCVEARVH